MSVTAQGKYRSLFEPAARGEWSLPEPVTAALATVERLSAALSGLPPAPDPDEPFVAAVDAALSADNPAGIDLSALLDHPRHLAEHDALAAVLRTAKGRADAELGVVIYDKRDEIITGHLGPAGEALWSPITKSVKALGDLDERNNDALLRAPDRVRSAWLSLDGLAAKYTRIREAHSRLLLHTDSQPKHDIHGDHAEFKIGFCHLAGPNYRGTPMGPTPQLPWPDDARGRLVWFARHNATPWWPTIAERDAAWMAVAAHKEAYDRIVRQQQRHRAVHGF